MGNNNNSRKVANDGFSSAKTAKNNAGKKSTSISVICMILVMALFVGVIVYTKVVDSGYFYRNTVSVSSANYEVDNAMLSYFFNTQYQNMSSSLEQMGVDLQKNLKDSQYTTSKSWFDYLMADVTIPNVKSILVLAEAAKAAGFELSEHDKEHIDEAIESIESMAESYAKAYGGTKDYYIRNLYGNVNLEDIRKAIELNQYAAAYSEHLTESYEFTEVEWSKYLAEHEADFQVIDYVYYTFTAKNFEAPKADGTEAVTTGVATSTSDETTAATTAPAEKELSADKKAAKDKATAVYQELMASGDNAPSVFNVRVKEFLETVVYASTEDETKKAESVQTAMDNTVATGVANDSSNEFLKYAFGDKVTTNAFMTEDDTNGNYTVYLITKKPYIQDYKTRNVRVIALSAASGDDVDEAREALISEFEEKGKTEEAFAELAKTHSADASAHENGGLYENQGIGELPTDELNDWLFSDERVAGDYTYASNGEKDANEVVYVLYYTGEGLIKWHRDVDNTMVSEAYSEDYKKLEETHKTDADLVEAYKIPGQAGIQ